MCFLAMPLLLLLVSALIFCTGEALGDIVSLKIQAIAGETVILPCTVSVKVDAVVPSVEWSKGPTIAFLYRHGCETFEEKNQTFQYRTNLFLKELKSGNASLRLSNAQLSDAGTYKCKTMIKGRPQEVGSIELSVDECCIKKDEFKTSGTPLIIIAVIEHIILCAICVFLYKTGVISVGDKNCSPPKQHTKVPQTEEDDDNGKKQTDELQREIFDLKYKRKGSTAN
ncbi:hypothetical protein JOQ06_019667 [Pogonophryne albipinna]|uniref:Ig-like domain-containing protein n=1 Tax=Pogonophryne albipinna TaxID=1090488 RepID=A0AAD6BQS3_9TELE|nr:hypothetical protein JOQ06_019667 [Pogonophryne albipinna]